MTALRFRQPEPAVLALDIGGTKLATALVTADGTVHGARRRATDRRLPAAAVIRQLFDQAHLTLSTPGPSLSPQAVSISCGGPLDAARGILLGPLHLPGWEGVPIGPMAQAEFDLPFVLANDATAAAWGEFRHGAGQGARTMIYLTLSTGLGGGAVIDGQLHRGAAGNGGELGHVTVRPGGRTCSCPRRGCLEAYCSGSSIAARAQEAIVAGRPRSTLSDLRVITAADVVTAAAAGDKLAGRVWAETVDLLGDGLTSLVNLFEPELVVLGGGVTHAGAMLLDPVRAAVVSRAVPPAATTCRIVLSRTPDLAALIGAGAIGHSQSARSTTPGVPHAV